MAVSCLVVGLLVASVFFAVPRGVTVGSLRFVPHNWHKKSDHGTYTLQLGVSMPVYNNNWYPVRCHLHMSTVCQPTAFAPPPVGDNRRACRRPLAGRYLFCSWTWWLALTLSMTSKWMPEARARYATGDASCSTWVFRCSWAC